MSNAVQVYCMSDIIRCAEKVIIISDLTNPQLRTEDEILKGWCDRVWTLPEVLLSRGDEVEILTATETRVILEIRGILETRGILKPMLKEIPKLSISHRVLNDGLAYQDLLSYFANKIQLSRLEMVEVALRCLTARKLKKHYKGDLSYVLMGLLRIRPQINHEDSSFQAFAR
jgi:hypothetical protein